MSCGIQNAAFPTSLHLPTLTFVLCPLQWCSPRPWYLFYLRSLHSIFQYFIGAKQYGKSFLISWGLFLYVLHWERVVSSEIGSCRLLMVNNQEQWEETKLVLVPLEIPWITIHIEILNAYLITSIFAEQHGIWNTHARYFCSNSFFKICLFNFYNSQNKI